MAPKWWQLMLHNDPLGRHLQYTPNIASLDHLTETPKPRERERIKFYSGRAYFIFEIKVAIFTLPQ